MIYLYLNLLFSFSGISVVIIFIAVLCYFIPPESVISLLRFNLFGNSDHDAFVLEDSIKNLEDKYSDVPQGLWFTLEYCLNNTLSNKPCVLTLFNKENIKYEQLVTDIGDLSVQFLKHVKNDPNPVGVIKMRSSNISPESFFSDLKLELQKKKVMVMYDLEKVRGDIVGQLHAFCDFHDPAVKGAVLVFLLNHKNVNVKCEGKPNALTCAFDILSKMWHNAIVQDIVTPLSVRITENAVFLPTYK